MEKTTRPDFVTEDMLVYLDELRESGDTNMFGATLYIQSEYPDLTKAQAIDVLIYWMHTFTERHSEASTT